MAYSIDFWSCVIEVMKSSPYSPISRATLSRWVKLNNEKGSLKDSPRAAYKVRK